LQTVVSRNVDPIDTAVVSVCNLNVGTGAFNIISDIAEIDGTVRTFSNETRALCRKRIQTITENICKAFDAQLEFEYIEQTEPTINTADGVEIARKAAESVVGDENVDIECAPCMGGEDFGAMLAEIPGAFVLIGQGDAENDNSPHNHGLHSPYYDFNDDSLPVGISYFATLIEQSLQLEK
jgi:hippurate hydrolase